MIIDITHIIRHDFREVGNRDKADSFVKKTINLLKNTLFIKASDDEFEY